MADMPDWLRYRVEIDPDGAADGLRRLRESLAALGGAVTQADVAAMAGARRRIKNISDPMERARIGSLVFGRAWVEVVYGDS